MILPQIISGILWLRTAFLALQGSMGTVGLALMTLSVILSVVIPAVSGLSESVSGLTQGLKDLENQMFRNTVQGKFTAAQWDEITERGYLTEEEFKQLAHALNMNTMELHDNMLAAGMLQVTMREADGPFRLYLKNFDDTSTAADDMAGGWGAAGPFDAVAVLQ